MKKSLNKIDQIILNQQQHEALDVTRFASIPSKEDMIKIVGETVDVKINGKLIALKEHLNNQDSDMQWIKWAVKGVMAGIGVLIITVIANIISAHITL